MTDEKKQCAAVITWLEHGWPRTSRCGKAGKYHEDGKDYCGHHLPSRVKAKRAERKKRWDLEYEAKQATWKHEAALTAAREAVIQAAKAWAEHGALLDGDGNEVAVDGTLMDAVANFRALEAKGPNNGTD